MRPLYTESEFNNAKSREPLPLQCIGCGSTFYAPKNRIQAAIRANGRYTKDYCSTSCQFSHRHPRGSVEEVSCRQCQSVFEKQSARIRKSKSGNHFCSKSCAAKWNNAHKKHGTRRAKIEVWLEEQLPIIFPGLEFQFNRKDAINSELDIYIPRLKLAFELNGLFHYEPIFGPEKLASIQNNDQRKFQACVEAGIELCIVDASSMTYFKPKKAQKYLDIISSVISKAIGDP